MYDIFDSVVGLGSGFLESLNPQSRITRNVNSKIHDTVCSSSLDPIHLVAHYIFKLGQGFLDILQIFNHKIKCGNNFCRKFCNLDS